MTAAEIVDQIKALGGRMLDGPFLWLPPSVPKTVKEYLRLEFGRARDAVLDLMPMEPPRFRQRALTAADRCYQCGLLVFEYDGDFDGVYDSCRLAAEAGLTTGNLLCPWARDGHPALKQGEDRWRRDQKYKMTQAARAEGEAAQPIPE